ncbi:MAG: DUF6064 family protein [Alphaproteobacteria bacterium]|nr:DUF6064 family protein [Alphaproteobacteria bacterium]
MNLSSGLPYDAEVYAVLMADYNRRWLAMVLLMSALALAALWLAWRNHVQGPRLLGCVLAFMAAWVGVAHQGLMMAEVNFAASAYAAAWLAFAFWLAARLAFAPPPRRLEPGRLRLVGVLVMAAALVLYPALQVLAAVPPGATDLIGVAPNATALFAAGAALAVAPRRRFDLLIVPVLWSGVAGLHGYLLGLPADYLIPALLFFCVAAYAMQRKASPA